MTPIIRVAVQLVATKQGRSTLGKIVLGVVSLFLIPAILIGGASTSFLSYLSNDEDVFAQAKNEVKEEMRIQNDMDTIFLRYLYSNSEETPEKEELIGMVKIFFVKRFDDPGIMERIRILYEAHAVAPPEEREAIYNEITELYVLAAQLARYEFRSREEILLLFQDFEPGFTETELEELKLFIRIIDEVKEGDEE